MEPAVQPRELGSVLCDDLGRGRDGAGAGRGGGEGGQKGADVCIHLVDLPCCAAEAKHCKATIPQ